MDGMATFVTRTSMMHMNWPSSSTASMSQWPGGVSSAVCPPEPVRRVCRAIMSSWLGPGNGRALPAKGRVTGMTNGRRGRGRLLVTGFRDAAFQVAALGDGAGQVQGRLVGGPGLGGTAEAAQELGPGRVPVLVARQVAAVDDGHGRGRA